MTDSTPTRSKRGPAATLPPDQVRPYYSRIAKQAWADRVILNAEQIAALAALAPVVNRAAAKVAAQNADHAKDVSD